MKNALITFLIFSIAISCFSQQQKPLSQYGTTNHLADGDLFGVSVRPFSAKEATKGITRANLIADLALNPTNGINSSQASNIVNQILLSSNLATLVKLIATTNGLQAEIDSLNANSNLITGGLVFVDAVRGSDATGHRQVFNYPYKTLGAAKTNALNGDTVIVYPGAYTDNNLLKSNVNWHFMAGAIVTWVDAAPWWGIFDDRPAGAVKTRITGAGTFNSTVSALNGNSFGMLVITNALSDVQMECSDIIVQGGFAQSQAAIYVQDASQVVVRFKTITDPTYGAATSLCSAIYWRRGPMYISGDLIQVEGNGVWADEPSTGTPNVSGYVRVQLMNCNQFAPVYMTGKSDNYRLWVDTLEAKCAVNSAVSSIGNGGKIYVTAQKLSSAAGSGFGVVSCSSALGSGGGTRLWINAQKVTGNGSWVNCAANWGGVLKMVCQEYEDSSGTMDGGFLLSSGTNIIQGGLAIITNAPGVVFKGLGFSTIADMIIQTTNTVQGGNTNNPVFVATNGLSLKSVRLNAPIGCASIGATNAQTVSLLGACSATTAVTNNVTLAGGSLSVDGVGTSVPAGPSGTNAWIGGTIYANETSVVGAGTAATNLQTFTVPANCLTNTHDRISVDTSGTLSLTGQSKQIQLIYGSETILDSGSQAVSNSSWIVRATIARTGPTAQYCMASLTWGPGPWQVTNATVRLAQTNGIATMLKVVGTSAVTSSIANEALFVEWKPASR